MRRDHVEITADDGLANAYFTRPDSGHPLHAVLLYTDALGLRPAFERMADRLAARGYAVLVPNVYYRNGEDPVGELPNPIDFAARPDLREIIRPLMQSLNNETISRDAADYLNFLAQSPDVTDGPVATTGYCMGTRLALRTAAILPDRVAAVGAFHGGGLVTDSPESPHLSVGPIRAEVYLAYADHDQGMSPDQMDRLGKALDEAGVRYRSEVYPDAPHGYAVADTSAYREWAAEKHFFELCELLQRTLPPDRR